MDTNEAFENSLAYVQRAASKILTYAPEDIKEIMVVNSVEIHRCFAEIHNDPNNLRRVVETVARFAVLIENADKFLGYREKLVPDDKEPVYSDSDIINLKQHFQNLKEFVETRTGKPYNYCNAIALEAYRDETKRVGDLCKAQLGGDYKERTRKLAIYEREIKAIGDICSALAASIDDLAKERPEITDPIQKLSTFRFSEGYNNMDKDPAQAETVAKYIASARLAANKLPPESHLECNNPKEAAFKKALEAAEEMVARKLSTMEPDSPSMQAYEKATAEQYKELGSKTGCIGMLIEAVFGASKERPNKTKHGK